MTVWLAGGSGLVGGALLRLLVREDAIAKVISAGRRRLALEHPRLKQALVDFSSPSALEALEAPGAAFCCLGSTIRKAGSREAFRAVDHGAVLAFAQAARRRGARVFLHVSALGADPRSRIFYNAVKGQAEESVARLGFESAYALRPSILDGEREESRPGESLALAVARALGPVLGKYRPTPAEAVAEAMVALARAPEPGWHIVEAGAILGMRRR
jgi:uncharacterized protein YbjT (DUF2867 family)